MKRAMCLKRTNTSAISKNADAIANAGSSGCSRCRILWLIVSYEVATEQQIEQARRDELTFLMGKIRDDIKQGYFSDRPPEEAQLFDKILQLLKEAWRAMSSYMHSGALQIGRRFIGDELKPNYSEGAIVEAVNLVTIALLLLLHMFFASMRCQKEDEETQALLRQYRA